MRELGSGGSGVVFLARDPVLGRFVALKIPRPETLFVTGLRRRFIREAQAAARLTHPNLVPVYEVARPVRSAISRPLSVKAPIWPNGCAGNPRP